MKRRDILKFAAGLGLSAFPAGRAMGAAKRGKVLFFTRSVGSEHAVVKREKGQPSFSEKVMKEMGDFADFQVECTKDGSVFDRGLDGYDAVIFYTCGDLIQPDTSGAPPMTPAGKQRLLDAISAGKGFVGIHSATDTFHSAGSQIDPYIAMLGGEWVTEGPQQEVGLFLATRRFPGTEGLGLAECIGFTDVWPSMKNFARDMHVIIMQETSLMTGDAYRRPDYPSTWARLHGQGRVYYTSLGHREDVWVNPFFKTMLIGGIAWAAGYVEAKIEPNIDAITPNANRLPA